MTEATLKRLASVVQKQKSAQMALLTQLEFLTLRVRELRAVNTALEQELWKLQKEMNGERQSQP